MKEQVVPVKFIYYAVFILIHMLGLIPIKFGNATLSGFNCFGSGFFLSVALVQIMPKAMIKCEEGFPWPCVCMLLGYSVLFVFEQIMKERKVDKMYEMPQKVVIDDNTSTARASSRGSNTRKRMITPIEQSPVQINISAEEEGCEHHNVFPFMNELPRINSGEVQIVITKESTESDEEFHSPKYMTGVGLILPIAVYSFYVA